MSFGASPVRRWIVICGGMISRASAIQEYILPCPEAGFGERKRVRRGCFREVLRRGRLFPARAVCPGQSRPGGSRLLNLPQAAQFGIFHDVEQLKFDAENIIGDGTAYAVEKVFSVFSRQSGDQMSDYADSTRCKPVYSFFVYGERITSSDALCGDFVGGLKTEFHPEKRSVVQIGQIVFDIRAKAVRPGSDSESRAQRVAERFFKSLFQQGDRRIGIGEILKICDAAENQAIFSAECRSERRSAP